MLDSLYMKVLGFAAVGMVAYFGYRYVVNLQEDAAAWQAKAVALELVVENQEAAISVLRKGVEQQQVLHDALAKDLSAARSQVDNVTKVFSNHDFSELLKAKPGLIHNRMRAGTKRVFLDFEKASRSYTVPDATGNVQPPG